MSCLSMPMILPLISRIRSGIGRLAEKNPDFLGKTRKKAFAVFPFVVGGGILDGHLLSFFAFLLIPITHDPHELVGIRSNDKTGVSSNHMLPCSINDPLPGTSGNRKDHSDVLGKE